MELTPTLSDKQARAARSLLGWVEREAAEKASIAISTLCDAERGVASGIIAARLRAAYESAGVEFTNGGQPGVRMRKAGPST